MPDFDLRAEAAFLTLEVEEEGDAILIRPSGELDISTIQVLDAALQNAMKSEASEVLLDLWELTFIDSTGLRLLVLAAERLHGSGNRLRMLRVSAPVSRSLEISGLDRSLPFID